MGSCNQRFSDIRTKQVFVSLNEKVSMLTFAEKAKILQGSMA